MDCGTDHVVLIVEANRPIATSDAACTGEDRLGVRLQLRRAQTAPFAQTHRSTTGKAPRAVSLLQIRRNPVYSKIEIELTLDAAR
jgi:hypothetical protein